MLFNVEDRFLSLENSTRQIANYTQNLGSISSLDRQLTQHISDVEDRFLGLENNAANYTRNLNSKLLMLMTTFKTVLDSYTRNKPASCSA